MSDLADTAPLAGLPEGGAPAPAAPAPEWMSELPGDENPYALRLRREPQLGEVTAGTRARLNQQEAYYRGTTTGSNELIEMARIAQMTPEVWDDYRRTREQQGQDIARGQPLGAAPSELGPPVILTPEEARQQLAHIRTDIEQYDTMPGFDSVGGFMAALGGQLAGGLQSPEAYINRLPGVRGILGRVFGTAAETVAGRIAESGLTQGLVNVATDPAAQAGAIVAGIQPDGYDWTRTAMAFPTGAAVGGAMHGAQEAVGAVARRLAARPGRPEVRAEVGEPVPAEGAPKPEGEAPPAETVPPTGEAAPATGETPPAPAPTGSTTAPQVEVIDRAAFLAGHTDANGATDLAAASDALATRVEAALAEGRIVTGYANGSPFRVVAVDRGMMQDAAGNRWGTIAIATDNTGGNRVEISAPPVAAAQTAAEAAGMAPAAAAEPGAVRTAAAAEPDIRARTGDEIRAAPQPLQGIPPAGTSTEPALSLQAQGSALADAIDLPLRQGRMASSTALGQYNTRQDVARVRNVADFEVVAHEAGHAIEQKVGADLTALTNRFAHELAPLDYDPTQARVFEGFAEWQRLYLTAPAAADREAPGFAIAYREFMQREHPQILEALDKAQAAYKAFTEARSDVRVDSMVQRSEPDRVMARIRRDGLPQTISLWVARAYEALLDDKAPVARAVRELARLWRDAAGHTVALEGSDNPELLLRMFARSHQSATGDMMQGVRPYHSVAPEGPSLRDALIHATGEPGIFGRWDDAKLKDFSNYLVTRRGQALWDKYDAGRLPNRPIAMSKADVLDALARYEADNPTFRDAGQMVHDYTRQLLRKMFEGGLIDKALYNELRAEAFYVPLMRDLSDKPLAGRGPTEGGAEGPGRAELIRRQRGSDRDVIDPIQSIMTQTFLVNRTLAHNDIIQSLVNLSRNAIKAGATGVGRILEEIKATDIVGTKFELNEAIKNAAKQHGLSNTDTQVLLGAVGNLFGPDPILASIFRHEPTSPRGEPIVFYKDGGALRAVRLISKDEGTALYETLTAMPAPIADWSVKLMASSASMLRLGIVTDPVFAFTNWTRDQLAASILRPGTIPFNPRGIVRTIRGDGYAQLYGYAGGISPGAGNLGLEDIVDQSVDALARKGWAVQKLGGLADLVTRGDVVGGLKAIGETVETAETGTRLNVFKAVYDQKRKQGLSEYDAMLEAAHQATDLLDFGRHGSGTDIIRKLVPFLNAHIQSLDKARRTMIEPLYRAATNGIITTADQAALKNAYASLAIMGGVGGGLGFAYGLWASSQDSYLDANTQLRATHLIVPGAAFGYPGKILTIPKPFELAIGFNLGEMIAQGLTTGDPRAAQFAAAGLTEVLAPPNVLNSIPIVKNWAELSLNRSFYTGRDIVPDRLQQLQPAEQYTERTSSLAKQIGRAINVSPIKVEYAIGGAFGLWGRDVLAASNVADPNAPAVGFEDTVGLRRVIKDANRASETTQKFWDLAAAQHGEYAQANNTYMQMLQQFRDADAGQFLARLPAATRAYVTLQSAADEQGKAAFAADEKRLQPLTRASTAVLAIQGYIRELNANTQTVDGERFTLDPGQRKQAIDALRELSRYEQQNALIITGQPGYVGRQLLSAEDQFKVIRALSPQVANEIATRYANGRIVPTKAVASLWPQAQQRLLSDGSAADLKDLAFESHEDGWAFDGEITRKRARRRVPIPAAVPAAAAAP